MSISCRSSFTQRSRRTSSPTIGKMSRAFRTLSKSCLRTWSIYSASISSSTSTSTSTTCRIRTKRSFRGSARCWRHMSPRRTNVYFTRVTQSTTSTSSRRIQSRMSYPSTQTSPLLRLSLAPASVSSILLRPALTMRENSRAVSSISSASRRGTYGKFAAASLSSATRRYVSCSL